MTRTEYFVKGTVPKDHCDCHVILKFCKVTKKLARELGSAGIRVNAVAPGLTQTKMLDVLETEAEEQIKKGLGMHRFGTPEEIAEVCLFLASDNSSYITGETIKVDGGGTDLRLSISK